MDIEEINLLKKFNPGDEYTEKIKRAIEHLLEENKDLKNHIKEFYNGECYTAKQLKQLEANQKKYFINKQKVKDKLEDYTERKRYYDGNNIFLDEEYYRIQGRIEILKELL